MAAMADTILSIASGLGQGGVQGGMNGPGGMQGGGMGGMPGSGMGGMQV